MSGPGATSGEPLEGAGTSATPCRCCGDSRFAEWEVASGGGLSIKLLPLSFFEGGKLIARACLSCGHLEWSVETATLDALRAWAAKNQR